MGLVVIDRTNNSDTPEGFSSDASLYFHMYGYLSAVVLVVPSLVLLVLLLLLMLAV